MLWNAKNGQVPLDRSVMPFVSFGRGEKALILLPGLAFDRQGHRLGYGGGYYDRFFAQSSCLTLAGFCFSFQLCREVPADPWDVAMDAVCTDEELVLP